MKPSIFENSDGGWAKSGEIVPATVERNTLGQTRLKSTTRKTGVRLRGTVRPAGRGAAALGLVWVLVGFWVHPAHAWWRRIDGVGGTSDQAYASTLDAGGDVIAVGQVSGDFEVVKISGTTGEELWRQEINGTAGDDDDVAQAVAVDGSGDVIAVGVLENSGTSRDFTVVKFSGVTGEELWRQEIDGTRQDSETNLYYDNARAVAVDGSGDVIAVGTLCNTGTGADFAVTKLSGPTGEELWRQEIAGRTVYYEFAQAVAVDGSGDVIAAGSLSNIGGREDFSVIKFSGATGNELWRRDIDGTATTGSGFHYEELEWAGAVAIDGSGDVIAAGSLDNRGTGQDFTVVKLSGDSGNELWRQEIHGTASYVNNDFAAAVAVNGSGDVIAVGHRGNSASTWDFIVIKFSGATGEELWRKNVDGTASTYSSYDRDMAQAVAVDGPGDVIVAGVLGNSATGRDFTVIKFSGATGDELWRQEIDGRGGTGYPCYGLDWAQAVAVDGSGDVIAAGYLCNSDTWHDFTVIKFSGTTGEFGGTHTGRLLLVKDDASDPERRRIKLLSNDPTWPLPAQGSANDPTLAGASVRLVNPSSGEEATFDLPPGPQWSVTSSVSGAVKYLYRDPSGINGPCIKLTAIPRKRVQAICAGSSGLIPFTLDEPSQGSLVVSVQFGGAEPQCAWFRDRVIKDQGTHDPGPTGIFRAKDAKAAAVPCPAPPSPSAAFLDVTTTVLD